MRRSIAAGFCVLWCAACGSSWAADGIKATATVSRAVPADIVQVSFALTDKLAAPGGEQATGRAAGDGAVALANELGRRGLRVLHRSYVVVGSSKDYASGSGGGLFGREATSPKDGAIIQRTHTFRIGGFKHPDEVLVHLAQLGVRPSSGLQLQSSEAASVTDELGLAASAEAVAKARRLAAHLGVTVGHVVDVATSLGRSETMSVGYSGHQQTAAEIGPDGLPRVVIAISATATLVAQK